MIILVNCLICQLSFHYQMIVIILKTTQRAQL